MSCASLWAGAGDVDKTNQQNTTIAITQFDDDDKMMMMMTCSAGTMSAPKQYTDSTNCQ